ncbi:dephospho-CoA kinase [Maribacter algarum]|uniref:Dephospho-CoA kinase n=2 Tax=Maribacter algarum (ex Zhang et al. 2020) TaxID=2578118 RepID=A0A5S3PSN5_9FLAO|nr:dephospho-CoA kinase [Maribacter algarum]
MMIVGLTGGIGSGKTTVANFFKELGVPIYNSDKEARKLMRTSKKVKNAIIELLGEEAFTGKKLNKTLISDKIFNNKKLLQKLNSIVHPAVRAHFVKWEKKQDAPYVIQETALIFENKSQDFYDKIILVVALEAQRIQRVSERDGISEEQVQNRLMNQLEDVEKIPFADYVIENTNLSKTKKEVNRVNKALLDYC